MTGDLIDYAGDPLLDFGLSNFLDRIAYKSPKTAEKAAKHRQRMAEYEKPVNEYNFTDGDVPENKREEEEFMYKFMKLKGPTKKKSVEVDEEAEDSDPELEAFAEGEIKKQMKKIAGGAASDDSEDDIDIEYSESQQGSDQEEEEGSDFFGGEEDLENVELSQEEQSEAGSEELED